MYFLIDNKNIYLFVYGMSLKDFCDAKRNVIVTFQINTTDTGSSSVQIALLTERIKYLTSHMIANPNDLAARLSLLKIVTKRTKLLKYLQKNYQEEYNNIIDRLKLKRK